MEETNLIKPGMALEENILVEEKHLASHVGSGSARVLSTPSLIGLMEMASHRLLAQRLPAGQSSVGVRVDIHHLAATPPGSTVRVRAEVQEVNGRQIHLKVQAWDEVELIGEGQHERFIIDEARFTKRVLAKAETIGKL